jgi:hypothetical protein
LRELAINFDAMLWFGDLGVGERGCVRSTSRSSYLASSAF